MVQLVQDGASKSETNEGSLPEVPKQSQYPVMPLAWAVFCGSGMADERAPTHLSGLQWLLYGEHPSVFAELDPMRP